MEILGSAKSKVKIFALTSLASVSAYSTDFKRPAWQDMRLLGRGDAGLATIVGAPAAFYNPAGLAWSDTYSITALNPWAGTNRNMIASFTNLTGLGGSSTQTLSEQFAPYLGKTLALQGGVFPHISIPGFMFGFYDMLDADATYRDPVYPRLEVNYRNDWGLITGFGWNYKDYIALGISVRWVNRSQIREDIDTATLLSVTSSYFDEVTRKGDTFGTNLGLQGKLPHGKSGKIAYGLVVEDVNGSKFRLDAPGVLRPDRQPMRVNAGLAYSLDLPASMVTAFFDTKDLNQESMSWSKKIYTGLEVATRVADFRAGLYQGYWTAGVSVAVLPFLLVDAVSYGRELDSAAGLREDRYYLVGVRMGLDLRKGSKRKQRFTLDHL